MQLPVSKECEVASHPQALPSRDSERTFGWSELWASNALFITAALLALAGHARRELTSQHASLQAGQLEATLFAQLEGDVALARMTLPPALDPHAAFDLRLPHAASVQLSNGYRALASARCDEAACVHRLQAERGHVERTITAQFRAPGRHELVLSQQGSHGEVRARYAVHVKRAP